MAFAFSSLNKNKYMLAVCCFLLGYCLPVYSSDVPVAESVHAQITHDALAGILSDANLKAVIDADDSQDKPGGEGIGEKRRHFDGRSMSASVAYINREKTTALNLAAEADTDQESRADALRHIGLMLHAVQDFYLRSNYTELQLHNPANRADPYNIALVDWSRVPNGYGDETGKLSAANHLEADDVLNKDSAGTVGGKVVVSGKITVFSVARELAVRETQRQWNSFESLVRSRVGTRAAAVIAALRSAAPKTSNAATATQTP